MSQTSCQKTAIAPTSATILQTKGSSKGSSLLVGSLPALPSPPPSPQTPRIDPVALPNSPTRIQPPRRAKQDLRSLNHESRLLALPNELLLMILDHLRRTSSIAVLALRYTHRLFYDLCSTFSIHADWHPVSGALRRAEFVLAERCVAEGVLRGLFDTGRMPCYKCLILKGKSCFSRDVREGNLAIGAKGFEQRRCQCCGGTDKETRKSYLKSISTIWGTDLTQSLPI